MLEKIYSDIIPKYYSMHVNDFKDLRFVKEKSLISAWDFTNGYNTLGNFDWYVVNTSYSKNIKGINTLLADLYPIGYNFKWLTLPCWSDWDGVVDAGDTISIFFVFEDFEFGSIDSLCETYMDVEIVISDSNQNLLIESIDSLQFVCTR